MKNPIIEIPRASEKLINALIDAGVLEVGADDMLHVKEETPLPCTVSGVTQAMSL